MMLNYMKGEWYRIVRGKEVYLLTGIVAALALVANLLLWAMSSTPDFPYATVRFSLSNLISSLPMLFFLAGLLAWILFSDDRKDGVLKNALAHGCSRFSLFAGRCLLVAGFGLVIMAIVLAVYIGSAVLLLAGSTEAVAILLKGVAFALPFTVACAVLAVAVLAVLPKASTAFLVWIVVVALAPMALNMLGFVVEPVRGVADLLPYNFFQNEVAINQGGLAEFLWETPEGAAKCLITGFVGVAVFGGVGAWRASKIEL